MEKVIKLGSNEEAIALYGSLDENLRFAENEFHVRVSARNHRLKIVGEKQDVERAWRYFSGHLKQFRDPARNQRAGTQSDLAVAEAMRGESVGGIQFVRRAKIIRGRTPHQADYLQAIHDKDIVVAIGPAGTGKTYLAMAAAIDYLKKKMVRKIILTRPAVEAGENLGFLPGDLAAKVNPYLRPLYDALYDMLEYDEAMRYIEQDVIEVAPLAYMRGRTLNDAFIILDEAQNCTHAQMKMFLTRLGQSSKAVITGDVTQIDLTAGKKSGLVEARMILSDIEGIKFMYFDETDVVRHPLVQEIIRAYEREEHRNA